MIITSQMIFRDINCNFANCRRRCPRWEWAHISTRYSTMSSSLECNSVWVCQRNAAFSDFDNLYSP